MRKRFLPVFCFLVLTGCSLSFDFDNEVEKLAAESIAGRAVMEAGGSGALVAVSPCRAAVRYTPLSASNAEDGQFTIRGVPAGEHEVIICCDPGGDGEYELKFRRPGVRLSSRDAVNLGDVVVVQTGSLIGMVYRNGVPAGGGVLVTLEGSDLFAYTSSDGSYRIDFVPPGQYVVFAASGTEVGEKTPVKIDPKDTAAADVDLHQTELRSSIVGRARIWRLGGSQGHGDIEVRLIGDAGTQTQLTGLDGSYSFENVLFGRYELQAHLAEHESARVPRVLVRDETAPTTPPDMFVIPESQTAEGSDDIDGDGIPNEDDDDSDNDGVNDDDDDFPTDGSEWEDTDGDGVGDNEDRDIDGDEVMNWDDSCPMVAADTADGCPTDCVDDDSDGYGEGAACLGPDCDDTDDAINPGAAEVCGNEVDEDCSGHYDDLDADADDLIDVACTVDGVTPGTDCDDADDAVGVGGTWYADLDGDTYGDASSSIVACDPPLDHVADSTDCDDTPGDGATINPGATEIVADAIDQDCDGGDLCYEDLDGDGHGTTTTAADDDLDCDNDSTTGTASLDDDCDDDAATGPGTYPGAAETAADGIDQDCDGGDLCFIDADNDGYRPDDTASVVSLDLDCEDAGEALATDPIGDCDDADGTVHPGAGEGVDDGVDQDCDGRELCYIDADNDGYRPDATTTVESMDTDCEDAGEALATDPTGDCDDAADTVHPGASEGVADGVDQNCDGEELCYLDADDDGYRPDGTSTVVSADLACDGAGEALSTDPTGDCEDGIETIHPGASEGVADGVDQNCDTEELCYLDGDDDGYRPGDGSSTVVSTDLDCSGAGEALATDPTGDCADDDDAVYPGATEVPADGVDQNCDGEELCYVDGDDDGYRPDGTSTVVSADLACDGVGEALGTDPVGDCNDGDASVYLGALEIAADGIDQDCSGGDSCYEDADGDGVGSDIHIADDDLDCGNASTPNTSSTTGDCCDAGTEGLPGCDAMSASTINPMANEIPADGVDMDCNGIERCYEDLDGDGYGTGTLVDDDDLNCDNASQPNMASLAGDCDDDVMACGASCNPGIIGEECDGYDNDCISGVPLDEQDEDGDGFLACAGYVDHGAGYAGGGDCCDSGLEPLPGCDAGSDQEIYPGALETPGDGTDQNCDGVEECYEDMDGDTYGTSSIVLDDDLDCDNESSPNMSSTDGDCDDDDMVCGVHCNPGIGVEECDGYDNDCAGGVPLDEQDEDGDGYLACAGYVEQGAGYTGGDDCDDSLATGASVNPGESEVPGNGVDDDCDGVEECYEDLDGDGYGTAVVVADDDLDCDNASTPNTASQTGDCDDNVLSCGAACNPGMAEHCRDCIDNDCDLQVDENDPDCACGDADGDYYCPPDDCDDDPITGVLASPALAEHCSDGIDNDCDGAVDGADPDCGCPDIDNDGYCPPADCMSDDPSACPGCPELCNGQDNDCNGVVDDVDLDADGHSPCASECTWVEGCFSWYDIASAPNELTNASGFDNDYEGATLDFSFPYFGGTYSEAWVSTNGFVQIGNANSADAPDNQDMPDGMPPDSILAAFWDDLDPSGDAAAKVYAEQRGFSPDRQLVVSWEGVPFAGLTGGGDPRVTFQAVMNENGGVALQYETIVEGSDPDRATGGSASIGGEDEYGEESAMYSYNTAQAVSAGTNLTLACRDYDDSDPLVFMDTGCTDNDGDGYGASCSLDEDCDDSRPLVHPGIPEIPDNSLDDDCSGGDQTIGDMTAIFVSGDLGSPVGLGTQADPLDTIQAGVDTVRLGGGQSVVVVAGGTYAEDVETDVSLIGGWDDNDLQSAWTRDLPGEPTTIAGLGAADAAVTVSGMTLIDGFVIQSSHAPAECSGVSVQGGTVYVTRSTVTGGDCTVGSTGIRVVDGHLYAINNDLIAGGEGVDRSSGVWMRRSTGRIEGNTMVRGQNTTATSAASLIAGVLLSDHSRAELEANAISAGVGTVVAGSRLCGVLSSDSALRADGNSIDGGSGGEESYGVRVLGGLMTMLWANDIRVSGGTAANDALRLTGSPINSSVTHRVINNFLIAGGGGVTTARGAAWDEGEVMMINNTIVADGTVLARGIELDPAATAYATGAVVNNYVNAGAGADHTALHTGAGSDVDLQYNVLLGGADGTCPVMDTADACVPAISGVNGCAWSGCSAAAANLDADCSFASWPDDLHLQNMDGNCQDMGMTPPDAYYPVNEDFDGQGRPIMSGWDIGADESTGPV